MRSHHARALAVVLFAAALCGAGRAQSLTPEASQKKADQIIDRMLKESGELDANTSINTRRDVGRMTLTGLGVSGEVEVLSKAPNKTRMGMKIAGIGEIVEAYDGETAWVQDPIQGYREKSGLELAATIRQADFNMAANYKTHYPKREWVGTEAVAGEPADKLRLHPTEGAPETWFIGKKSSLLIRMDSVSHLPQGDIESQVYLENYKRIDGVMEPTRVRVENPISPVTMELTSSETNVPLDDALFASPRKKGPEEIVIVQ